MVASRAGATSPVLQPHGRRALFALLLAAFALSVAGLLRTLPLLPDVDEAIYVNAALRIASSGDLNPGFFGNPGATTIYPLALLSKLWHVITQGGGLRVPDAALAQHGLDYAWEYFYLGRLLSVGWHVLGVLLTVKIGRLVWNDRVGLAAGWFVALSGLVVYYSKLVRTDSAATFFGLLALWLALRLLERTSLRRQIAAGAALGLALSSRYFMAAAGIVLLAVDLILLARKKEPGRRSLLPQMAAGLLSAPLVFLLANPAMLPQWRTVAANLRNEARAEHLGADGLSPLGNLWYYLSDAIPETLKWPLVVAALAGIAPALAGRSAKPRPLLLYVAAFLSLISVSSLHWQRWIIQIVPPLCLFAAAALDWAASKMEPRLGERPARLLFAAGALLLLAWPGARTLLMDIRHTGPNTRLLAREWILANVPAESAILQEEYGAALAGTPYAVETIRALADRGDVETLLERGYDTERAADLIVASSDIYGRFLAEPARYPEQVDFYEELSASGTLVQRFVPPWWGSGPVLELYQPDGKD